MFSYAQDDQELKRSLNYNIFAITFGMVFFTIFGVPVGSALFTGFMRILGAGDLVYSVVMALPVLGAISQIFGSYFLETTGKRKFLFLASGFVHRLLWIPVAIIPLFLGVNMHMTCIWIITVLITISSIASSVTGIAFNSWMGTLIPLEIAGRFFGIRTLISTISGAVAGLCVGAFIDNVNNINGFAIVFIIGSLFGVVDIATYFKIKHPPLILSEKKPSLRNIIIEPFKNRNYLKLALFATVFGFTVNIPAPFFNVYMIENLKMDYFIIALSNQITASIATILFVRKFGVLVDRYGNKPIVFVGAIGISVVPILWMFTSSSNYSMVFVANFVAGVFWAAYNLGIFNQMLWFAPERNRSAYLACFAVLTNVFGVAVAYICGGYFMQYIGPVIDNMNIPFVMGAKLNSYQVMFFISTIMRFVAIAVFFPHVKEEKASSLRHMLKEELQPVKEWVIKRQ
jgi:MFS family permease